MKTINLIGGGRVGQTLGHLLSRDGHYLVQDLLTRSTASAEQALAFIGSGRAVGQIQDMRPADLWLLAVPDGQIAPVAAALAGRDVLPPAKVFHASGALSALELQPLKDKGWQVASAHCLLEALPRSSLCSTIRCLRYPASASSCASPAPARAWPPTAWAA